MLVAVGGKRRAAFLRCKWRFATGAPVLTEAAFLLARVGADPGLVADLVTRGLLTVARYSRHDCAKQHRPGEAVAGVSPLDAVAHSV